MGSTGHTDLALGHRFQQGSLYFGGGTVDFVS